MPSTDPLVDLTNPSAVIELLRDSWQLREPARGLRNLRHLSQSLGSDRLRELLGPLGRILPRLSDPDMALNTLERFLATPSGNQRLPDLLERNARGLESTLQLFAVSEFLGDVLASNPDFLDLVRANPRRRPTLDELCQSLQASLDAADTDSAVLRAFRRFRRREMLRIGIADILRDRSLEEITQDLSTVADAALTVALRTALRTLSARFGTPMTTAGRPAQFCVLAFGKLGGVELNYSSDLDLMAIFDSDGGTQSPSGRGSISNEEFYSRVVTEIVRLLSAHTDQGQAYRVDLRLRPEGHRGPLVRSLAATLAYYDTFGRTWERQALIKVRPVAGDIALGETFLTTIEPFVYRKYLSFAEINEIKAMKRRIERAVQQAGECDTDVKIGRGGIRDIEFTVQFLQLANAGDLPQLRQRNTLNALAALEQVGAITAQEYAKLDAGYRLLRKIEHRLQLLFDLQTHRLPTAPEELRKLALRMGYGQSQPGRVVRPQLLGNDLGPQKRSPLDELDEPLLDTRQLLIEPLDRFMFDYQEHTRLNREILDHLLHQTFSADDRDAEPESDLILDPQPDEATIRAVLGRYPFRDIPTAYACLTQLAQESVRFLSTRRCRHFLASIAPRLLRALAETPDPDLALVNLEKVTASLGCKAVLWELFTFNPPSLKLYVDLCANSSFLSEILINNPGMIDEVLDSLVLNRPRTAAQMRAELAELTRGAEDVELILHSFQDKELLRIGIRDLLGKDDIQATELALSDLAEVILQQTVAWLIPPLQERYGQPIIGEGPNAGQPCRHVIVGLGKLGGREISYHSDLDLMLIYEADGQTAPGPHGEQTDNLHYFTQLAQRIIKVLSSLGPLGRLYAVDMRLRPTGKSGSLAIPLTEFRRYFQDGQAGRIWERQALTRARPVQGDPDFAAEVMAAIEQVVYHRDWQPADTAAIRSMRERIEAGSNERNLKRGPGGIVDVEFLVQMLQLRYGQAKPSLRTPSIWQALDALHAEGLLSDSEYGQLKDGYGFLRLVESRLRIVTNRALEELPASCDDLEKLARRLGYEPRDGKSAAIHFLIDRERYRQQIRQLYLTVPDR
jgi:glutamate-ammonia-ligase adenylyltransferase